MSLVRPASYQREYTDYWSGDSAFIQPPPAPPETATEDELARHKKALEEHARKIRVARETSSWQSLLVEGGRPSAFIMGQVDRNICRALGDRMLLSPQNPRWIGPGELTALMFRLAIREITEFDVEVVRAPDPRWNGWVMAQADLINELDGLDPRIVGELGDEVLKRLQGISPK